MSNESTNIIETMSAELEHLRPMEASLEMAEADVKAYKQHIAILEKEIAELKEERRWRSVSEELPSHDTWCIVYHEGEIDVDHYTDDCNSHDRFVMYGFYVTHWMPLPKAPEEADK